MYVDGSTAPHGAHACRASNGQQLCEPCECRLNRAQEKLHVYGSGHICAKCDHRRRRERLPRNPGPSAAHIARRSHWRKVRDSEAGQLRHDATSAVDLSHFLSSYIPSLHVLPSLATLKSSTYGGLLVLLHEGATHLLSFCLWILLSRFHMQRGMNGRPFLIAHQLYTLANSLPSPVPAGTIALVRSVVAQHGIRRPSASYRYVMHRVC
jgi:hypothetical protein